MSSRVIMLLLLLLALATPAAAQDVPFRNDFQLQTLDYGPQNSSVFGVASSNVGATLRPSADLVFEYTDDPIVVRRRVNGDAVEEFALVDERFLLDFGIALGLARWLQVDLRTSLIAFQDGSGFDQVSGVETANLDPFAFGDVRVGAIAQLLRRGTIAPVGLALRGLLWLPTGGADGFASDGTVRFEPRLVGDVEVGRVLLMGNVGYMIRPDRIVWNYRSDDVFRWGLAMRAPIASGFGVDASIFGAHSPFSGRDPNAPDTDAPNRRAHPVEAMLGGSWTRWGLTGALGVGTALTRSVGAPRLRVVASIGYAPLDDQAAGLVAKPTDDVEDCIGPCVSDDADDDGDGVLNRDDACPQEPGDPERFGCPIRDSDGDGIADLDDGCPDEPEDVDAFEDEDGCPEPDNDRDGLLDGEDQCPLEAETFNGFDDEDGCPDDDAALVRLADDRIEILETVHFDNDRATIKQRSYALLEQVADLLERYPSVRKVAIEGHTDSRGSNAHNQDLSARRARAVREFLVSRGVATSRLEALGFGESHPVATNDTDEGRAQNRRVEFLIVDQEKKP